MNQTEHTVDVEQLADDIRIYHSALDLYETDREFSAVADLIRSFPGVRGVAFQGPRAIAVISTNFETLDARIRALLATRDAKCSILLNDRQVRMIEKFDPEVVRRFKNGHCKEAIAHDLKMPKAKVSRIVKAYC